MRKLFFICFMLFPIATMAANTPTTKFVGRYQDWILQTHGSGKSRVCYLLSQPKKSEPTKINGKTINRGDVYMLITREKSGKNFKDVVSFVAGYPYKKDSDASCAIDKKANYKLFTNNDRAWAPDDATDKNLLLSMRRGNQMTIKGMSSRGTVTTDTISLKGLTAGYKALVKEAGRA
jgi:invasion protein IalB